MTSETHPDAQIPLGDRIQVATNAGTLFLLTDAAFIYSALQMTKIPIGLPYVVALAVPAAATLLLLLLATTLEDLIPNGKLEAAHIVTLPLVFAALTFTSSLLFGQLGTTSSLTAPAPALAPSSLWRNPVILGACLVLHLIVISIAYKVQARRKAA